jgi:hypothetical protein
MAEGNQLVLAGRYRVLGKVDCGTLADVEGRRDLVGDLPRVEAVVAQDGSPLAVLAQKGSPVAVLAKKGPPAPPAAAR